MASEEENSVLYHPIFPFHSGGGLDTNKTFKDEMDSLNPYDPNLHHHHHSTLEDARNRCFPYRENQIADMLSDERQAIIELAELCGDMSNGISLYTDHLLRDNVLEKRTLPLQNSCSIDKVKRYCKRMDVADPEPFAIVSLPKGNLSLDVSKPYTMVSLPKGNQSPDSSNRTVKEKDHYKPLPLFYNKEENQLNIGVSNRIRKGSGRRCIVESCTRVSQGGSQLCISHGGGRRCTALDCRKAAQSHGLCKAHGGGVRCTAEGCTKSSQGGGFCRSHGGGKRCQVKDCPRGAQRGNHCAKHGGFRFCSVTGCVRTDRGGGFCEIHRKDKLCTIDNCKKLSKTFGLCTMHLRERQQDSQLCLREQDSSITQQQDIPFYNEIS